MPDPLDQNFQAQVRGQPWRFRLTMTERTAGSACAGGPFYGFALSVTSTPRPSTTVTTILQKDGVRLPARRDCAFSYWPVEVRVQGDHLAVLLAYGGSGFEDEGNTNYILVTGSRPTP